MRRCRLQLVVALIVMTMALPALGDEHAELPAGPIRDRHQLMEGIGKQAHTIGDALKSGDFGPVPAAAEHIQAHAATIPGLFPEGSTHPKSRAKPEIWDSWEEFVAAAKALETATGTLVTVSNEDGDVREAAAAVFAACKSCHKKFRVPKHH